jgi:glycine/serine hydroxymethyltransferase
MHSLMERKTAEMENERRYTNMTQNVDEIQEQQFAEGGRVLRLDSVQMVKGFPSIKQRANS